jgi:ribonuclease D
MSEPEPRPHLVDGDATLPAFLAALAGAPCIGVDTESNSMHAYRERLCLIQVATPGAQWLLDPLSPVDMAPFLRLLEDPTVTKVLHDAEYDVIQLRRAYGTQLRGLFDTKVAALALREPVLGLAGLVERHFSVHLDKSQQRSDWGRRPLDERQLRYASADVRWLQPLADTLKERIDDSDPIVAKEIECELRRLERLEVRPLACTTDGWRRLADPRKLTAVQRRCLCELHRWREKVAEARDVPPFKVMPNVVLVTLAKARPASPAALADLGVLPGALLDRHGKALLGVLERAAAMPGLDTAEPCEPPDSRPSEADRLALDRLKHWRRETAQRRPTDPSLVLNRLVMEELVRRPRPADIDDLRRMGLLEEWQVETYGAGILQALHEPEPVPRKRGQS